MKRTEIYRGYDTVALYVAAKIKTKKSRLKDDKIQFDLQFSTKETNYNTEVDVSLILCMGEVLKTFRWKSETCNYVTVDF